MSNVTIDVERTPAAAAQPEPETKPKKPAKGAKPATKAKASKKAKPAAKKSGAAKPAGEHANKKAEVIAMMKRAKGATLAEIQEAPPSAQRGRLKGSRDWTIAFAPGGVFVHTL